MSNAFTELGNSKVMPQEIQNTEHLPIVLLYKTISSANGTVVHLVKMGHKVYELTAHIHYPNH